MERQGPAFCGFCGICYDAIMDSEKNLHTITATPWSQVESSLTEIQPIEGGFSDAKRGLVTLSDGQKLFVKISTKDHNLAWLQKEIRVYDLLRKYNFSHVPELVSTDPDQTMFALEYLDSKDGWDWTNTWTVDRLEATLLAVDALSDIDFAGEDRSKLGGGLALTRESNGWLPLLNDHELWEKLSAKLPETLRQTLESRLAELSHKSDTYNFNEDTLGHHDLRADNCAWNPTLKLVKLIDWNWLHYGDKAIDMASFMTHVHQNGVDVLAHARERLDKEALQFIAGFWFKAAVTPIWEGGPANLRDYQFKSALTAWELADSI